MCLIFVAFQVWDTVSQDSGIQENRITIKLQFHLKSDEVMIKCCILSAIPTRGSREHFFQVFLKMWDPTREFSLIMKNAYILPRGIHTTIGKAKYDEQIFGMPNAQFGTFVAFSNDGR